MPHIKVLIIHLSRLGDMIQSLPALKLFKEDHPESEVTYLAIEDFCVPLKGIPWIDNLVAISASDGLGLTMEAPDIDVQALANLLDKNPVLNTNYDVLVNMTHSRGSSYLAEQIKAKEKRGRVFSKENEIVMAGDWGKYLFAAARNRNDNLLNLVDIYTGMMGVQNRPVKGYLPTNPETDRLCLDRLKEHGFDPGRIAVGFQLGASKSLRTWPSECFFSLGKLLEEDMDAQVILFGSEKERALADQFYKSAPFRFIDLIGGTTLTDLPSFLKNINVLVSNDTGPMHIAAAVGTKVVGIFMSTGYFRMTGPYGAGHIAVQSNYPCAPCLDSTACAQPLCGKSILPETVLRGVKLAIGLECGPTDGSNSASLYVSEFDKNGTLLYERLDDQKDHFLPWLRSCHDSKAWVSQTLWNEWLGLKPNSHQLQVAERDTAITEILQDYKNACLSYGMLSTHGEKACQDIVSEFQKARPNLESIQDMISRIKQVEQGIRNLKTPLAMLKDVYELYSAEVDYCNFPTLAHQFIRKYDELNKITRCFESRLEQIG